jgi:hypothetical protein
VAVDLRPREETFTGEHPEVLRGDSLGGYSFAMTRVDSETVAPIRKGHPTLGWEGDPRLQMYWDGVVHRHTLVRLEHDGEYRPVCSTPPHTILNEEWVNRLVAKLVATDANRGFDVRAAMDARNAAVDAEKARVQGDKFDAMADKLRWALKKDHADYYV